MKKLFRRTTYISLLLVLFVSLFGLSIKAVNADEIDKVTDVGGAKYHVTGMVEENILPEGVIQTKYTAESSSPFTGFSAAGSGGGGENVADKYYPQSVNILDIPATGTTRIINWTYTSATSSAIWTKATVVEMAKNFEQNNPGWKVIAAVNGDFFDINAKGNLPYQTSGVAVCDGEVIRPIKSGVSVGFKTENSRKYYINSSDFSCSENHVLTTYDENGNVLATFEVKHMNEMPTANETAIYYPYPSSPTEYTNPTLPSGGYVSILPDRMAPMSNSMVYAKGSVELSDATVELVRGQFGVYTNNLEVKKALEEAHKVRVQREVTGTYAGCENISGGGVRLVAEGKGLYSDDKSRHPRTMVGVKADGTIVFATVDGRQPSNNMYGMTDMEMSALMEYHGCVEANNMDGGGSTTMIIREGNGFRVMNSPSDKTERRDANALLVVVPSLSLEISEIGTTSFELNIPTIDARITISDLVVDVNNQKFTAENDKVVVTGLNPGEEYKVNYTFNLTYDGKTTSENGTEFIVKTSKILPIVKVFKCTYDGETYTIDYELDDPQGTIDSVYFKFDRRTVNATDLTSKTLTYKSESVETVSIYYSYNTGATNSSYQTGSETLCKVVFDNDGDITEEFVRRGELVKEKKVKMPGYVFDGWYLDDAKFNFKEPITENIILTAQYSEKTNNSGINCGAATIVNLCSLIAIATLLILKRK